MDTKRKKDSLQPINVSQETWLYAERKGLLVVHEVRRNDMTLLVTTQVSIPWSKIEKAIKVRP